MTDTSARSMLRIAALALALNLVAIVWLAVLTKIVIDRPAPVFVSVSLKSLLERHIEALGAEDLSSTEQQRRIDAYVAALERATARLADEADVIVLVSEAVVGGNVTNLTPDIARLAGELSTEGASDER